MDSYCDRKYMLFLEKCNQSDIPAEERHLVFLIVLTEHTRQLYFDLLKKQNLDLNGLVEGMRYRFLTPERTRALINEWDELSLSKAMRNRFESSASLCLEFLIKRLTDIQFSVPHKYHHESILRNKLLNAVRNVDCCKLAYHKSADTVQSGISVLHFSLATNIQGHSHLQMSPTPIAHYVDRRVVQIKFLSFRSNSPQNTKQTRKKSFVCGKPGRQSTNRSAKDYLHAYKKNKSIRQFFAGFNYDHDDLEDEDTDVAVAVEDVIAQFIRIDVQDENLDGKADDRTNTDISFCHLATIVDDENQTAFTARLNSIAFAHSACHFLPKTCFQTECISMMADFGVAKESSLEAMQYQTYCKFVGQALVIDKSKAAVACLFGIGAAKCHGIASINFPIKDLWFSFNAHLLDAGTLLLLSIDDMDRLGRHFGNLAILTIHKQSDE